MPTRRSAKKWKCPKCGNCTSSPLPILEAVCAATSRHPNKKTVAMKPEEEDEPVAASH